MRQLAILGEFNAGFLPHVATNAALEHSRLFLNCDVEYVWVATDEIEYSLLERLSGLWIAPGSPYRDLATTLDAIRYARENRVPCLGTCGGFQHMVLEYAKHPRIQ